MRSTDLQYRSPKEPNPPFRLDPTNDEPKSKQSIIFGKGYRWSHGSIYEITRRTESVVGPQSYNNLTKNSKPCGAMIKPSYVEEITGQRDGVFEMINGMRILQVCNLKKPEQTSTQKLQRGNSLILSYRKQARQEFGERVTKGVTVD